ncbi:TBC1 domain family member 7 [Culex quinquefasciatus]|uniref:TBC1 domain family member 7 n=1 Tax=Culex quinquefasciatus TaxID=7176 RepID=B0WS62_CULQU|nr:TBC1 domain family member 7 [Culex quinquefasciatus]EDS33685.1 TBC1 domain family member 7 [Culex quinquefasciatus]|eukprot:XP_001851546.1 TBC1 domain family member 7 [Culex quinquefasciatus]
MDDKRNFRSTYYEKVGCRGVEERKSLEILLKDKPLNVLKLKQFCILFTVPNIHRNVLWNFLLGVTPAYTDSRQYVMQQRIAVYDDLLRALQVMGTIDDKTPKNRVLYAMWLLETKQLCLGFDLQQECSFVNITEVLLQVFENDIEIYWMAKGFHVLSEEIREEMGMLLDLTETILEKEDNGIYIHLKQCDILPGLPLPKWYSSFFSGVLSELALIRIWDKICGRSNKIVIFVFIEIMRTLRRRVLRCMDLKSLLECIDSIKDEQETADMIVNKAIELWQQNKGHKEYNIPKPLN